MLLILLFFAAVAGAFLGSCAGALWWAFAQLGAFTEPTDQHIRALVIIGSIALPLAISALLGIAVLLEGTKR